MDHVRPTGQLLVEQGHGEAVELAVRALGHGLAQNAELGMPSYPASDGFAQLLTLSGLGGREDLRTFEYHTCLLLLRPEANYQICKKLFCFGNVKIS